MPGGTIFQPHLLLVVRTADCVPVLLADINRRAIAAVHAGWRGAVAGIVPATLSVLENRFGTKPKDVRAAIGPSIGVCCFEVDHPVITPLKEQYSYWSDLLMPVSSTHSKLDLRKLVTHQLRHYGLTSEAISRSEDCTQCDATRFFSYRREGRVNGTMISGIMINPRVGGEFD